MGAFEQRLRPSAQRRVALSDIGQRRARSMDQLLAKILVAPLADAEQLRLAAGGELPRDEAQPGRKIATSIEGLRSPTAATSADATIAPNPGIVASRRASSFSFTQRTNSASKAAIRRSSSGPLRASIGDQKDHPRAQSRSALFVHQTRRGIARASACPAER